MCVCMRIVAFLIPAHCSIVTSPPHRPYDTELGERVSLKVKPIQKKVEMQYKIEEAGVMYQQ